VAARYAGLRMRESMALGALMNTRGLTELIVVTVGLNYGVVSPALFTMLVLVALVTTFMAGPALRLIDPSRQLSVPPEEELQAAPTVRQANLDGPLPKRSILIAPLDDQNLEPLVALAEPLAHAQPPHGVMLARLLQPPQAATGGPIAGERALAAASRTLERRRDQLAAGGIAARAMACISPHPGQDLVQLASLQEIDLVLVDGRRPLLGQGVPRGNPGTCLAQAPSDVACLVGPRGSVPDIGPDRPIAIPFGGAEHDWAALELAARIAGAHGAPIRLLGTSGEPLAGNRDATSLVADAALVVQQLTGVATEPVLVSLGDMAKVGGEAGLLVVGISHQGRVQGLAPMHSEIVHALPVHVLFVRRGTRPGILAWPRPDVSFLVRHRNRRLNACMKERGSRRPRSCTHGSCTTAPVSLDRADRPATSHTGRLDRAGPQFGTDASGFTCPDRRVAVGAGRYEDDGRIWSTAAANRPGSVTAKPWPKQARRGRSLARRAAERRFCS
jgi:hypothetical protein